MPVWSMGYNARLMEPSTKITRSYEKVGKNEKMMEYEKNHKLWMSLTMIGKLSFFNSELEFQLLASVSPDICPIFTKSHWYKKKKHA